jgi:hypothetical protein
MNWSPKRTLGTGVALILAVNAIALTGVAYNRSGEPESRLLLTERELYRPHQNWGFDHENSGLALKLQWRVRTEAFQKSESYYPFQDRYGHPVWLTPEKLAQLGFDVSSPADRERRYRKLRAREVLLVLELDGDTYRAALERARIDAREAANREAAAKRLEHEERTASRLFAVDAGTDIQALRAKYPERSRYAIVHGRVQATLIGEGKQARVRGHIEAVSIEDINVPLELRPVFEGLPPDYGYGTPARRFEALLAHGRRLEPWLASARVNTSQP